MQENERKKRESLLIDLLDWLLLYKIYLESLGPNLQSRLEALEAAMGVRLNVAKRQGRHSVSNSTYNYHLKKKFFLVFSITIYYSYKFITDANFTYIDIVDSDKFNYNNNFTFNIISS